MSDDKTKSGVVQKPTKTGTIVEGGTKSGVTIPPAKPQGMRDTVGKSTNKSR